MPRPLKVFLCHAHSDKDSVKVLYARLKREGVDVWLDKEKLLPGADWEYEIRKAVRESDVVIVCLSKQFNQAGFRQKEVRIALEEADRKPEGEIFIIPARLEECDNLESLGRWHWVDLFEGDGFQRLILALRIRADKIGATLRQRGATISRQKKDVEQQGAEEEKEQERQRLAKEQAEQEANEEATREKAEREKTERETAARLARENKERDVPQKATREKEEREKIEKARKAEQARSKKSLPVTGGKKEFAPNSTIRNLGIAGIVLLLFTFGWNSLLNKSPDETLPTASQVFTKTPEPPTDTKIPVIAILKPTETVVPTPTLGVGSTTVSEKDGMVMVLVPAGEFTMGSGGEEHQVNVDAFWIDQTEVTNAMYAKCVADGDCNPPKSSRSYARVLYYGNPAYDDYPVIYVDWNQGIAYCKWVGRELPTEAEWEKAARGTDGGTYPWGEEVDCDKANYNFSCAGDTSEVGSYSDGASIYGALDMAGNVWEWVSSLYKGYPYSTTDGREDLSASGARMLRGGSWDYDDYGVRSAYRYGRDPTLTSNSLGFRCALSP